MSEVAVRFCPYCGMGDDVHDWTDCEREHDRREAERIERDGPCAYHDYGLTFDCTCKPEQPR